MTNNQNNPSPEMLALVRAHVADRVALLASCARSATALNNSATRWAYAEGRALAAGLTDRDAIQRAVCEKFPKVTGNGKVSKTPNSSFKTSFDKFVLLADVSAGEHKTYASAAAASIAASFFADDNAVRDSEGAIVRFKLSLNDAVDKIKADHAAAGREARANETEEEKAKRKAREAAEGNGVVAGIVANDGAVMLALAERITAMETETAVAFAEPLRRLLEATEATLQRAIAATPAEEMKKAA